MSDPAKGFEQALVVGRPANHAPKRRHIRVVNEPVGEAVIGVSQFIVKLHLRAVVSDSQLPGREGPPATRRSRLKPSGFGLRPRCVDCGLKLRYGGR